MEISITVSVPEVVLQSQFVREMILQKMQRKTAPDLQKMFKQTVQGWADPPNFLQRFRNSPSQVSATVWPGQNTTGGKKWAIVNAGSPRHVIRPRKARMLRFQPGYRASTRPRKLSSRAYTRYGPVIRTLSVQHPGFEAREFNKEIKEQYADTFVQDMQDAIRVASVRK